jgi:capsular exopolysaccharide synthesis family protein
MSKMFDKLRRAESERRKNVTTRVAEAPQVVRPRVAERPVYEGTLPEEFMRQMGILRNALETVFVGRQKRTLLFTSATEEEGTTTIATNFARFLAMQGQHRILVCELNARRPSFAKVFSLNGTRGMTDYFSQRVDLRTLVHTIEPDDIDVLHVGREDPTVIQVHLGQVLPEFLEDALDLYDTIIIDAPPVVDCPETPPMAGLVDGVVMVVRVGRTKRETVARAIERITRFDGEVLGVVLNRKKFYIPEFLYKRI